MPMNVPPSTDTLVPAPRASSSGASALLVFVAATEDLMSSDRSTKSVQPSATSHCKALGAETRTSAADPGCWGSIRTCAARIRAPARAKYAPLAVPLDATVLIGSDAASRYWVIQLYPSEPTQSCPPPITK
eukprot:3934094-Rhodomonas_salina.15